MGTGQRVYLMKKFLFLLMALGAVGLIFLYYQSMIKPKMIHYYCQKHFTLDPDIISCLDLHKDTLFFWTNK
jgi:cell division septal protein FtsQ